MKNRNLVMLVSFVLLSAASLFTFLFDSESKSEINHEYFRVVDTEKIDEVTLTSASDTVDLRFQNSRWNVNGLWDADVQMIKVLFATLRQVEPRRPVAASVRDSVIQELATKGVRVNLFQDGQKSLSFLAGGNGEKTETWFLKEGDTEPFVMSIPGYRVYAAGIFELEKNGWRSRRVFDFNWRNFKSLTVHFPLESKNDFEIEMQGRYFGIKGMPQADTTRLNNFLDAVSLLFADRFIKDPASLNDTTGIARFEITDIGNRKYTLEVLRSDKQDREVYGKLTSGEFVAFRRNSIGELMRKREYFRTER